MRSVGVFVICLSLLCPMFAANPQSDLDNRRKALNDLLAEQWEYHLRTSPIFASILGDKRWNDQLDDFSQKAIDEDLEQTQKFLTRFEAVDTTGFPEQEALNKTLMVRDLKMSLEGAKFRPWEMPVSQVSGVHIDLPQLVSILSFQSVKDYEDYISRLRQIPRLMDENVIQMRKGMAENLMPPRFLLEKVVEQSNAIISKGPEATPYAQPFAKFPQGISDADQKRLHDQGIAAIRDSVIPAYTKFSAFVRDEYAPKGRTEPGIWSLPDGPARYAFRVKEVTTTDLTPEQIHQIGLEQVKEIEGRMLQVANQLGFKDVKTFNASIKTNPQLKVHSREEILDLYRKYLDQMNTRGCQIVRAFAQGEAGSAADRGVPREGIGHALRPAGTGWVAAGTRHGEHRGHRTSDYDRYRDHGVSRGHTRSPHADCDRAGVARASGVSAERLLHGIHRGVGVVLGAAGERAGILPGSVQLLRALAG